MQELKNKIHCKSVSIFYIFFFFIFHFSGISNIALSDMRFTYIKKKKKISGGDKRIYNYKNIFLSHAQEREFQKALFLFSSIFVA